MALPPVVTREEWLRERKELLGREKELTRARDALNADRRRLPMVEVSGDYRFTGPDGEVSLVDLFAGRAQLIVQHVMFDPSWDEACSACSAGLDEVAPGLLEHLHARRTTFVAVSRAPYEKLAAVAAARGWTFPWVSSAGSGFNRDFGVTLDPAAGPVEYNYRDAEGAAGEQPGVSCFLRAGDAVFHTYSSFARGVEYLGGAYSWLDLTAFGRQEDWEQPAGRVLDARQPVPDFAE